MFYRVSAAFIASALALAASPAQAQSTVGSSSFATHRNCTDPAAPCGGDLPGQTIATSSRGGGVGVAGYNGLDIGGGNQSWSNVTFGAFDLPVIQAFTNAPGNVRMNINVFGFQSYVYSGSGATPFSIAGNLHIVDSSVTTHPDVTGDYGAGTNDYAGGAFAGGSIYTQYVGVWSPSILAGLTTAEQLFNALFYADCSTAGVLGFGTNGGNLTGGERNISVSTSTECGAGSLTLTPGQEVLVVAGIQLPVNRGGFVDASSTFSTMLDQGVLTSDQIANIMANTTSAIGNGTPVRIIPGVPEPATWLSMILGFGLVGGLVRSRRRHGKAALATA